MVPAGGSDGGGRRKATAMGMILVALVLLNI